jgi:hypothetical protein
MAALETQDQSRGVNLSDIAPPLNLLPSGEEKGKNGERGKGEGFLFWMEGTYMTNKNNISFVAMFKRDRHLFLLLSLLSLMLIIPLFHGIFELNTLIDISVTAIFLSSLYAISQKAQNLRIALGLILPIIAGMWLANLMDIPNIRLLVDFCAILFYAFIIIIILSALLKEHKVTLDVIYGAVAVFLLMALMWAFIFDVIETLQSGSFQVTVDHSQGTRIHFLYYSFVTITTVGYGDILPVSLIARAFSILEMVVGQFYLIILVARLVGINITQSMEKKSE